MVGDDERGWNLRLVRAPEALARLRDATPHGRIDWNEVEVAHLDTGYTEHPVFGPWQGGRSRILQVERGRNYVEPGAPPRDPLDYEGFPGHGTRTASVLCGDLPGTLSGVAPGLPVVPYRVTDTVILAAKRWRQNIARAIRDAVDEGCEVISISLGFPVLSMFGGRPLGAAVDDAYESGVIVVAAGGQGADRVSYPGKYWRSIGVGGVRPDRTVWWEYERTMLGHIDAWAPADRVRRANTVLVDGAPAPGPYAPGDGTSYATVHVAAAAAMWIAYHKDGIERTYTAPWQRIEAFRTLLHATGQEVAGAYRPVADEAAASETGILDIAAVLGAGLPAVDDLVFEGRKAADMWG